MSVTDPPPMKAEGLVSTISLTTPSASPIAAAARRTSLRLSRVSAAIAIGVGMVVLVGWAFGLPTITSLLPHLSSMKATTALCMALSGAALMLLVAEGESSKRSALVYFASAVVGAIALLTLAQYALAVDIGIDRLLWYDDAISVKSPFPGRMGLNTAAALAALAGALASKAAFRTRLLWVSDLLATAVFLIALLPALGYLYSAPSLTGIASYTQMSVHTSLTLLMLAIGTVAVAPSGPIHAAFASAEPGGVLIRRLVPTYAVILVLLGWARLAGQERGYYGLQVGVAIMIMASLVAFAISTAAAARAIDAGARARAITQRDLEERELRYRLLIDATFGGTVVSQNGRIREANAGYAEMFGYSLDELIGMSVYPLLAEESHDVARERIRKGIDGQYDVVGLRKDGTRFTFETVVRTHGEGPDQLRVAALRDTSQQRKLEAQLRQSQKMDAIGHLAGGVAHDFNNLLTVILSYTLLLLRENHSERTKEELQQILKAAESASGLTRQLLAFSRQQVLEPRLISLNTVVTNAQKLLNRLLGEDIAIRTVLASDVYSVKADPGQLEQVIMNLAVNARDAMPDGGKLVIETANVKFDAKQAATHPSVTEGEFVQLTVTDSGIGMDAETKAQIFEPFFTTKGVGKGTGLGLASVYGIVQQSGGHIWVYSEPGQGTTFKVYFPAIKEPIASIAAPTWPAPSFRGTETILMAEDATDVRQLTRSVLESLGYLVLDAADPAAAVKTARGYRDRIDLLLTDVVMPGMSGRQLADQLTAERPEMKVLFVSGYTSDTMLQRGILKPGMTMLQKPYTPDSLARKVRDVLDNRVTA